LSTQLSIEQRKEFANVMVEKDYPFLSTIHKLCYKKIDDHQFISENSELNCIYPSNVTQLRSELEKLEVKDRAVIYKGNIEILDHKMFKEVVVKKAKLIFPDEDMQEFGFILNSTANKDIEYIASFDIDNLLGLANDLISDLHLSEKLPGIKDRIKNQKARIGVFGLTKVGKSTFLNTLIGKEILKSDRGVATNIVTIIKKSPLNKVKVCFIDERIIEVPLEEIPLYTSEQGNPQNKKNVSQVEVMLNCALPSGLEILDIPGFGVNEENHHLHQEVIDKCLSMVDGVFLVTTPNDGLKSYEIEFIKKAFLDKKIPFVLIANKMDELDDNDVLDLKPGLQEKLQKNGLSNGMFPIYFVSSQLGLAFIEGIEKNRYLGRSIEEAQVESGLLLVKESVRSISEKILSLKESSIIGALSVEVEKYKQSQIRIILDTEIVQKNSSSENEIAIDTLKDEISELKSLLSSELNIFGSNLKSLHDLDIDGMVNRLSGKVEFGLFSRKKEDNQNAKDQCEKIFKDEIGCILQFMDESIETCNANLKQFIESRKGTPFTFDEVQFSDSAGNYNQAEVGTMDNVGHIITKLLAQSDTVRNECMKILSYIKQREVSFRVNQLKGVQAQEASFESSLNVRINNIEEAMSYKEGEFKQKVTYCTEQVEKSNHYLRKLQI
jgi:small GTP-binding protein